MGDRMSAAEFAAKVEWEGGVLEALEYGLTVDDIDLGEVELRGLWGPLQDAYRTLGPLVDAAEAFLSGFGES